MSLFNTIYGRNLVGELKNFVHRPYVVVTMADLWPRFEAEFDENLATVHLVDSMDEVLTIALDGEIVAGLVCLTGAGGLVRNYPHVPGIDAAAAERRWQSYLEAVADEPGSEPGR